MPETADISAGEEKKTEERIRPGGETETTEKNDLLSLMESWDVETYLEETDTEESQCKYFKQTGSCPYQEVGCMFQHSQHQTSQDQGEPHLELELAVEVEEVEDVKEENKPGVRERLSARSRNRKINEERFRRMRDLSISCS